MKKSAIIIAAISAFLVFLIIIVTVTVNKQPEEEVVAERVHTAETIYTFEIEATGSDKLEDGAMIHFRVPPEIAYMEDDDIARSKYGMPAGYGIVDVDEDGFAFVGGITRIKPEDSVAYVKGTFDNTYEDSEEPKTEFTYPVTIYYTYSSKTVASQNAPISHVLATLKDGRVNIKRIYVANK